MGLFGKLFEKKICAICDGEIGLFGNRKLEDGNLCKDCAAKLSPWFDDRRHSTVEQIREQLEYREENKAKVAAFQTTRTLGDSTKVLLDENAGVFAVSSERNIIDENPDVLSFSDVTGCNFEIDEDTTELYRTNEEGESVSYNPPRYSHSYDFNITIFVNNPYFNEISFRLNDSSVEIEESAGLASAQAMGFVFGGARGQFDPEKNADYRSYKAMGEEVKEALLQVRQQVREEAVAAAAPKAAVVCQYCGATTMPDANGCCEFCGSGIVG